MELIDIKKSIGLHPDKLFFGWFNECSKLDGKISKPILKTNLLIPISKWVD